MRNPSEYIRKAYQMYDQGRISLTEFVGAVQDVHDYAYFWEEHQSLNCKVAEMEEDLDRKLS